MEWYGWTMVELQSGGTWCGRVKWVSYAKKSGDLVLHVDGVLAKSLNTHPDGRA